VNVEVWWPTSNTRQEFANVSKNQFLEIKEFAATYTKLERNAVKLGGAKRESRLAQPPSPENAKSR
jgi:hypothetical protein